MRAIIEMFKFVLAFTILVAPLSAMAHDPCMGMKVLEDSYARRAADLNNPQRMAYGDKQADMHAKRLACEAAAAKEPDFVKH